MFPDNNETIIDYANSNQRNSQEPQKNRHTAIIVSLVIVLVILLGLFVSVYLTRQQVTFRSKASGAVDNGAVSIANSYIFASPLRAKAGNDEKIRVTVFVLDSKGLGVYGRTVGIINGDDFLSASVVQSTTDDLGKAIFDITSPKAGVFTLGAQVDGVLLIQEVKVTFE